MRLADFIIGGAPRSGTTWLYQVLDMHPEIYMAKPVRPEPKFFITDKYRLGLSEYSKWFELAKEHQVAGEKTTNYLECALAADRMLKCIPHVKLIFILREPAERAWSNYLWSRMNNLENLTFDEACESEVAREVNYPEEYSVSRPHSYLSRGMYADFLAPYYKTFKADQILVLRFEDIQADAAQLIDRVHQFLRVLPRPEDGLVVPQVNSARSDGLRFSAQSRARLEAIYRAPNERLRRILGHTSPLWSYE